MAPPSKTLAAAPAVAAPVTSGVYACCARAEAPLGSTPLAEVLGLALAEREHEASFKTKSLRSCGEWRT